MKRVLAFAMGAVLVAGAASVYAGGACCPSKKAKAQAKAEGKAGCGDVFAKLNLSEDQKAKMEALRAECKQAGCTEASHEKFWKGMKEILTPEQLAQCKAECEKTDKATCPFPKGEKKS